MGMAASQARLLTITARMHDVEYQAQSIQNAKVALATQSDQIYQEYLDALDATTLTITDYQGNIHTANFNNICGLNSVDSQFNYAFFDERGRLIVDDDVAEGYSNFRKEHPNGDAYAFAMYMLGIEYPVDGVEFDEEKYADAYEKVQTKINAGNSKTDQDLKDLWESIEKMAKDKGIDFTGDEQDGASRLYKRGQDKEFDAMLARYNYQLQRRYAEEIYNSIYGETTTDEEGNTITQKPYNEFDEDKFNYYANWFKKIQASGGVCVGVNSTVEVSKFDGFDGDAANNSEWLQNMIKCGKITVDHVNQDKKSGEISFSATSVPSDGELEYTTTTTIDKTALAKAEAEYEHKTKQIDQKDKRFDLDLSKLDTERTALKTEYESVKKVIEENIDRTFGIFS